MAEYRKNYDAMFFLTFRLIIAIVMNHPFLQEYGLSSSEFLDALSRRFRAKVAVEGVVAELLLERKLKSLVGNAIERFESYDKDGFPDFGVWIGGKASPLLIECKNVRNSPGYTRRGEVIGYQVETQKTRASKSDPSSRFYRNDHFSILAVCLGKKTKNWNDFAFIEAQFLKRHKTHEECLAVMHFVPLISSIDTHPNWYFDLESLLKRMKGQSDDP